MAATTAHEMDQLYSLTQSMQWKAFIEYQSSLIDILHKELEWADSLTKISFLQGKIAAVRQTMVLQKTIEDAMAAQ